MSAHEMQKSSDVQIILLGESGVGKTSLLLRFVSGLFRESLPRTIVDSKKKVIKIKDMTVNLFIWDTAGQEMYNSLVRGYYRLADGVILAYDVQNADTFIKLSKWLVDLRKFNEKAEVLIAGTKSEDPSRKSVNITMVKNFALAEGLEHVEVSSKSGSNVDFLFRHLIKKILAARGILTFSKSCLLERLARNGEYIDPSSIDSEHSIPSEDEEKSNADETAVADSQDVVNVGLENDVENSVDTPTIIATHQRQQRAEEQNEEAATHVVECVDDSDTDTDTESAECALQFFETFSEETQTFVVVEHGDIIKLTDETVDRKSKRKFCLI